MRTLRKKVPTPPYDTLSDLAMGTLGIFVLLIVAVVVISSLDASTVNQSNSKALQKNEQLNATLASITKQIQVYQNSNFIEQQKTLLSNEHKQLSDQLNQTIQNLEHAQNKLNSDKARYDELSSAINVLDATKKERADLIVELDKLEAELKSLEDRNTGYGADRTGRAYMHYYTYTPKYYSDLQDTLFVIGKETFTLDQFSGLLDSFGYEGENSFFVRFYNAKHYSNCDTSKPLWTNIFFDEAGWVDIDVKKKVGYN